jgi:dTDP-glucose pyrophosphorylase
MSEIPLPPTALLVDAIRAIEESRRRIAVVTDPDGLVVGTLTDGDIRRTLLGAGTLQTPVSDAMNGHPIVAEAGSPDGYLLDLMRRGNVMAVPVVDAAGRYVRVVHLNDLTPDADPVGDGAGFAFAVIMAGGEGTRLRPITETIPKPMIDIGGAPLLERQILRLGRAGVKRMFISVNYLSHVIERHFGSGERFGVEVQYLREDERLGTAGALSLLTERPSSPIVVMNGDILTNCDFGSLLTYHRIHAASVTVAAVDHHVNIPYGVLNTEGAYVTALREKPSQRFLCNAGVYAVSPDALRLLPASGRCDMPELVQACLDAGRRVAVFPIHEYWSDIGTAADLERARELFSSAS